jgi:hypothetical protein
LRFYEGVGVGVLKIEEPELEVLKIEESESELLCTDSTALVSSDNRMLILREKLHLTEYADKG